MLIIARNDLYKINFGYISIGSNKSNVLIRRLFLDRELCIIKANTCQYLSARGKICGHVSIERSFFISLCETFLYSVDNLTFLVSCSPLSSNEYRFGRKYMEEVYRLHRIQWQDGLDP